MCESFPAALLLPAIWLILGLVICGLGFHVRRLFGLGEPTFRDLFPAFWSGWVTTLALLQVWHLWFPVDRRALVFIVVLGAAGLARERRSWRAFRVSGIAAAAALLLGVGVAHLALGPMKYFDTGFYHLATVEWIRIYPIVPGLGNLHGRLAFNSSFFLYAALLENLWTDGGRYLANSLPIFVLLLQVLRGAARYLRARWGQGHEPRLGDLVSLLLVGPIAAQVLGPSFSSLSSDMPVFALGIAVTLSVLRLATRKPESFAAGLYHVTTLALWVAGGVSVKLSFLVYGCLMMVLALIVWWRGSARIPRQALAALGLAAAAAAVVVVPWTVRSVYLSGYFVFPGGHLPVDVDWRVPRALALDHEKFIYGMARSRSDHWVETAGNWTWLERWWRELPGTTTRHLAVAATALLALLARAALLTRALLARQIRRSRRDPPRGAAALVGVVVAALLSLTWWFATAPDPRFAGALFAILPAGLGALAFPGKRLELVAAAVFLGVLAVPTYDSVYQQAYCRPPEWDYVTRTTDSGLAVHVPTQGIQCWKLPLPSTPYFRPSLGLRRPGDLSQGFFLDPSVTLADLEEGSIPIGFEVPPEVGLHLVSGWARVEPSDRRILRGTGRMLLFTERSRRVRLRLLAASIRKDGEALARCELEVLLRGASQARLELRPRVPLAVDLTLGRDFNDLVLRVSAGGMPPSRRIEVTFDQVGIDSFPGDVGPDLVK